MYGRYIFSLVQFSSVDVYSIISNVFYQHYIYIGVGELEHTAEGFVGSTASLASRHAHGEGMRCLQICVFVCACLYA